MATDPYRYFRVEARELLEQLGQGALDLEKRTPSPDDIARLLRLAHTLKGAARVVKQPEIAEHAHALEDRLTAVRAAATDIPREDIDRMLALLDAMTQRVAALGPARDSPTPPGAEIAEREELDHILRPEAEDVESVVDGLAEIQAQLGAVRPALEETDRLRHLIDLIGDQLTRFEGRGRGMPAIDRARWDRVRSMMDELRGRFGRFERTVADGIDQMEAELRHVSDAAARLRLLPAAVLFRFLERAARDAAQALGKRVRLEGHGGDVRLDSGMLTIVQAALVQLVRNAVAHGIEASEAERRLAGKPPEGVVTVVVSRRGKWLSFTCSDDGRGIDFDAVRRRLRETQPTLDHVDALDTVALVQRLLRGGVSTSGTVTGVSGRGVGLDVVREAAERLQGDVTLRTKDGEGTTIELVVPFSIASFHALLVEAAGVPAAVPLEAILGTVRLTRDQIIEGAHGAATIVHAGRSLPFSTLHRVLRPSQSNADRGAALKSSSPAFIVESESGAAAVAVDRIVGIANVVARPLPDLAPALPGIVGASVDTSGFPRLVVDPGSLVTDARRGGWRHGEATTARTSILVVDDSLTTRMLEQSILESAGYDVGLASSGEEGLQTARAGNYALLLVDVEMPGMDGFSFVEQVRADPQLRATPAILVTSRASANDQQRGRDVGAQGYIIKSEFDQGALLDRIRTLLR
jgi:two-component system, chemotaxis family, sensor kinase CheA